MTRSLSKNRLQEFLPSNWVEFDTLLGQVFGPNTAVRSARGPAARAGVWEDGSRYYVELDVPGVAREDIGLTFEKGVLQIDIERKQAEEEQKGLHDERYYGKTTRKLGLPETIDPESISAELANGVLTVSIAKVPEAQPKRIDIK